mmetsp:Transcript_10697/g.27508  ORF Transcript_10697/g.27508 Transcript_10697/m.27508 type:complete len:489 (-) Transcript_10697:1480-2946(-)
MTNALSTQTTARVRRPAPTHLEASPVRVILDSAGREQRALTTTSVHSTQTIATPTPHAPMLMGLSRAAVTEVTAEMVLLALTSTSAPSTPTTAPMKRLAPTVMDRFRARATQGTLVPEQAVPTLTSASPALRRARRYNAVRIRWARSYASLSTSVRTDRTTARPWQCARTRTRALASRAPATRGIRGPGRCATTSTSALRFRALTRAPTIPGDSAAHATTQVVRLLVAPPGWHAERSTSAPAGLTTVHRRGRAATLPDLSHASATRGTLATVSLAPISTSALPEIARAVPTESVRTWTGASRAAATLATLAMESPAPTTTSAPRPRHTFAGETRLAIITTAATHVPATVATVKLQRKLHEQMYLSAQPSLVAVQTRASMVERARLPSLASIVTAMARGGWGRVAKATATNALPQRRMTTIAPRMQHASTTLDHFRARVTLATPAAARPARTWTNVLSARTTAVRMGFAQTLQALFFARATHPPTRAMV